MRTDIWVTHHYGAWEITHKKTFYLKFAPFPGLVILDEVKDGECRIELISHHYCDTIIAYHAATKKFEVDVREHWRNPVREDVVDDILEMFKACKWERKDRTNIDDLKKLMKDDYLRSCLP